MDFLGYAALGGFERIAIVGGAVLIGYWGYRIYGRDKTPGLIFLGLACAVLISALVTGGGHVRSVSEGIQLASAAKVAAPSVAPAAAVAAALPQDAAVIPWADAQPASATAGSNTATDSSAAPDSAAGDAAASSTAVVPQAESDVEPAAATVDLAATDAAASVAEALGVAASGAPQEASVPLATGQELGGRIVAIKSANVTLEWSDRE